MHVHTFVTMPKSYLLPIIIIRSIRKSTITKMKQTNQKKPVGNYSINIFEQFYMVQIYRFSLSCQNRFDGRNCEPHMHTQS